MDLGSTIESESGISTALPDCHTYLHADKPKPELRLSSRAAMGEHEMPVSGSWLHVPVTF